MDEHYKSDRGGGVIKRKFVQGMKNNPCTMYKMQSTHTHTK